jgi:O-antigen ligase
MEDRGLQNTRESLWKQRLKEFNDRPVFGVGFASEDNGLVDIRKKDKSGKIEPGSSYLMILSMTGFAGAISILFFLSKILFDKKFWKLTTKKEIYKLAVLGFFSIHFFSEGYLFASGSLMAFVFWTLIGSIYPYSLKNIIKDDKK